MELEFPAEPQSLKNLCFRSLKRSLKFSHDCLLPPQDPESKKIHLSHKIDIDYGGLLIKGKSIDQTNCLKSQPHRSNLVALPGPIVVTGNPIPKEVHDQEINNTGLSERIDLSTREIMERIPSKWPRPIWHAPWKNYRVISGHLGWVRSVAVDPSNNWFCTGSSDRTIKIWDLASGRLKLTLTGHIEQIRGLAVSTKHTYMFSAGDDKQVKCWDLEQNKVIRSYHGHLSGVYCLSLHPSIDVIFTGGRDSVCRVWDIRSKMQIHALSGHENTVCSVFSRTTDPQIVTGSHDNTIKLWDLRMGRTITTLTHHKKSIRAMALHPKEEIFASASYDNIKKFNLPQGEFLHNMLSHQKTIINAMAVNEEGVLTTAGDDGSLWFWDWKSGHNFQQARNILQPGSLEGEGAIYAMAYDMTGSRLISCGGDKTIKMWKQDENATPETHPLHFKLPKYIRRF